ncbi:hypothetical protein N790_07985 [Arenimonas malthae CC-JY-1]|uniref:Lipoprotein n=1 Tax=Arenimonas malthae CC-JY-1 TaxID=1384054 RepID=A0A091B3K5_9GAMM|nr:hypothetical protein [Arenimonas malthae]KFN47188.1 hypothetical protein N790_07985 [Arenimonas malthae CC-JY-1]
MKPLPLLAATLAAAALSACTPAQVKLPAGFSERAVAHAVSGHSPRRFNQPLHFGPYSARRMHEGDTFHWEAPIGRTGLRGSERPYAFTLTTLGQPPVEVQCASRQAVLRHGDDDASLELDLTAFEGPLLACGLRLGEAAPVRLLELSVHRHGYEGRLDSPWGPLAIRSLHGYAGSGFTSMEANGFEVQRAGEPWMVVETINAGRVLLDPAADPRQQAYLAAAATALLLLDADLGD